jgi:hypothetical protein
MIRVKRPVPVPAVLSTDGEVANQANKDAFDKDEQAYRDGSEKIIISDKIYNHSTVKVELKKAQHDKCCYCEKKQRDEPGAVEHFRPKSGYQVAKKTKLIRPGYYWLGYEWTNFYFTCCDCNTCKRNLFPLVQEKHRAKTYKDDWKREKPLLLEPGGRKNPQTHIVFDGPLAVGMSEYGWKTIEICGLNRSGLVDDRRAYLDLIARELRFLRKKNSTPKEIREAKRFLRECQRPTAPFSAAASDFLKPFLS